MKKYVFQTAAVFICALHANGQDLPLANDVEWVTLAPTDALSEVANTPAYVFAKAHIAGDSIGSSRGRKEKTSDGKTRWSIGYTSAGALNMSVCVSNAPLTGDAILAVYTTDGLSVSQLTAEKNNIQRNVGSDVLVGDSIIVFYEGDDTSPFKITNVYTGFRNIGNNASAANKAAGMYGSSGSCEMPAACFPLYADQRRAVCRLIAMSGKSGQYGTGTLINNTANDGKPLVLTAAHVVERPLTSLTARFRYEEATCDSPQEPEEQNWIDIKGAEIVAYDETADMCILQLSSAPDDQYAPYWCGWDATDDPQPTYACIHHPYGDVMKISESNTVVAQKSYTLDKTNSGEAFRSDFHWLISEWETGATEAGSSGSAIFNADGNIFGSLSGGSASCYKPKNDYFWRLDKAMTLEAEEGLSSLAEILDPVGNGTATHANGLDYGDLKSGDDTEDEQIVSTFRIIRTSQGLAILADSLTDVHIWDAIGRLCYECKNDGTYSDDIQISTSGWSKGIYTIHVRTTSCKRRFKIAIK